MDYNMETLLPYIPPSEYDNVATEFLETYYPDALDKPQAIPILDIVKNGMKLDLKFVCLSEEVDIFGMTIFDDGFVEIYNPEEGLYEAQFFKKKTVLIDPEAVKKTNIGCRNNTIAHEAVHWYKHRMYYRMQKYSLLMKAKYCKCNINDFQYINEDESIMESQAVGIAPRILMPKKPFIEVAKAYNIKSAEANWREIAEIAQLFDVSKQSVQIRLQECDLL